MFVCVFRRPSEGKKLGTWRIFSLRELHAATNNFNYDNKLGEGGFGSVYWGQLASGDQVRGTPIFCSFNQHLHKTSAILLSLPFLSIAQRHWN